jgi:hypothetical protein
MSLLLSWKDTLRRKPEKASSVVGIDYEVRMERFAQPWAAGELLGPSSLPHILLEDAISFSEGPSERPIQKIYGVYGNRNARFQDS